MANFGKGLMYALKGSLEGLAAGAEKEDKEREELSKTILAGSLKNIGLAKQLQQEQKEKDKEMQAAIESIMKISQRKTEILRVLELVQPMLVILAILEIQTQMFQNYRRQDQELS